jgi:hypothetical protein
VLGAFLLGTLAPSIGERETFIGMVAGLVTMSAVWLGTSVAFTWYVFIGASTTCAVAWAANRLMPTAVDVRALPRS